MDYLTNKGIYKITCTANGKFYIGSSVNLKRRRYWHFHELETNTHANKHLQRAYNMYGSEAFIFEILESFPKTITPKELFVIEQQYIDTLVPWDPQIGYNACKITGKPGIRTGFNHSEKTKQIMSEQRKGKPKSESFKQTMSKLTKGKSMKERTNNPNWVDPRKGKTMKEITGDPNWTDSRIGKKRSPETIEKIKNTKRSKPNPMLGRRFKRDPKTIRRGPDHPCYGRKGKRGVDSPMFGKTGSKHNGFKPEQITLINKQGETISNTRFEWRSQKVDINALLNKTQFSSKGWALYNP